MNIFRFQHDAVVPGFSNLFFFFFSAWWVHVQLRSRTLISPWMHVQYVYTYTNHSGFEENSRKKSTHAKLKRAKPKFFHFFPFAVRLYPLNSTNHSHTHRSTINLFHFDFNRFMRKSFTLPMCLKSSCFVPWRLPWAHILFLTNENEKIYVWVLFFSFIRLHVTPNIVRHLLYENLI